MERSRSVWGFRGLVTVFGLVAIAAGAVTVLRGLDAVPGPHISAPSVDSELRFFAVWYLGAGVLLLWAAANLRRAARLITAIAALLFAAGLARALSWATVGEPHRLFQVLMVVELVIPVVVILWQRAIAAQT